jgi:hypothetical protein
MAFYTDTMPHATDENLCALNFAICNTSETVV